LDLGVFFGARRVEDGRFKLGGALPIPVEEVNAVALALQRRLDVDDAVRNGLFRGRLRYQRLLLGTRGQKGLGLFAQGGLLGNLNLHEVGQLHEAESELGFGGEFVFLRYEFA
jgi:hypothetical protein